MSQRKPPKPCACGCGTLIAPLRTWAQGHQPLGDNGKPRSHAKQSILRPCACGCGKSVPIPDYGRAGRWHPDCSDAKATHERKLKQQQNRREHQREKGGPSRGQSRNDPTQARREPIRRCDECSDLPHRRPLVGCPSCGRAFAEERTRGIIECSTGYSSSMIATAQKWAYW